MNSPVFYIIVAMIFASITLSVIFFLAWKTQGEKPYALSWSVAFLAASGQWICNLAKDVFPSHVAYWLTVNALALAVITLSVRGHCQRTGCERLPKNLWPYAGIVYAAIIWSTAISPHVGLSMALVPASACITLIFSAFIIIQHREISRSAEWAAAASLAIFGLTQGVAAGVVAMQGATVDPTYMALYVNFNFLTLPAGYMATGMLVVFMLASDLSEQMKDIAIHDQLTNVLNRRGLGEQGAAAYATARRNRLPVSIIMTDIDRFKTINDQFGHAVGDQALVHFAELLKADRRADDILARVGGEEFALILPGTDLKHALAVADELRTQIDVTPFDAGQSKLPMTASFGVAELSANDTCLSDAVARADQALYRSKRGGRNQVDLESSQLMLAADGTLKPVDA